MARDRRTRLIAFLDRNACRQHRCRIGDGVLDFDHLTDGALEQIAECVCKDFWSRRRRNAECHTLYAVQERRAA